MPSGTLEVPAQYLPEVIKTIRIGLDYRITQHDMLYDDEVYIKLTKWCEDMETFLLLAAQKPRRGD